MSHPQRQQKERLESEGVIRRLEETIRLIKSGHIVGLIGATVEHDGTCRFFVSGLAAEYPTLAEDMALRLYQRVKDKVH